MIFPVSRRLQEAFMVIENLREKPELMVRQFAVTAGAKEGQPGPFREFCTLSPIERTNLW